MAHFALIEDGVVTSVLVAEQDFIDTQAGTWVQTSYNTRGGVHLLGGTPLRKNYAQIGRTYDAERDAFYGRQPYPSWSLDEDTCTWKPPVPFPSDANEETRYNWDEETLTWIEITE